jgi:hypothetical protein
MAGSVPPAFSSNSPQCASAANRGNAAANAHACENAVGMYPVLALSDAVGDSCRVQFPRAICNER